jgi:thiamine pyrophosphate-dependent acetolactate synthase large subunit-like protein
MLRQHLRRRSPRAFSRVRRTGQGIGTALGIKLAARRPVALLVRTAHLTTHHQALGASQRHELPIIIVVLNNKKYKPCEKATCTTIPMVSRPAETALA